MTSTSTPSTTSSGTGSSHELRRVTCKQAATSQCAARPWAYAACTLETWVRRHLRPPSDGIEACSGGISTRGMPRIPRAAHAQTPMPHSEPWQGLAVAVHCRMASAALAGLRVQSSLRLQKLCSKLRAIVIHHCAHAPWDLASARCAPCPESLGTRGILQWFLICAAYRDRTPCRPRAACRIYCLGHNHSGLRVWSPFGPPHAIRE